MSYQLHITRKARSWADAGDPAVISLPEWEAYVRQDPEMRLADYRDQDDTQQHGASITEGAFSAGRSIWLAYARPAQPGRYTWFYYAQGSLTVQDPDEVVLGKMLAIAHKLQARVQGDKDEYLDQPAALQAFARALPKPAASEQPEIAARALPETAATPPPAAPSKELPAAANRPAASSTAFQLFQTFASPEAARLLLAALAEHGIATQTELDNGELAFDPSFANNRLLSKFLVKIPLADFERGGQLLDELNSQALQEAAPDHYLFSFTDEELLELRTKPEEWSAYDVALAGQLLQQRGQSAAPDTLRLRQHQAATPAQPGQDEHKTLVISGYISAVIGGLLGVLIGYQLCTSHTELANGQRVPTYSPANRMHGLGMMVLGTIMFVLLATRFGFLPL